MRHVDSGDVPHLDYRNTRSNTVASGVYALQQCRLLLTPGSEGTMLADDIADTHLSVQVVWKVRSNPLGMYLSPQAERLAAIMQRTVAQLSTLGKSAHLAMFKSI